MTGLPIITFLTLLPIVGGMIVMGIGAERPRLIRGLTLAISFAALAVVLAMWGSFDAGSGSFQFEQRHSWIPTLNIEYRVAVDGLGMIMLLLTALVTPMALLASRNLFADGPSHSAQASERPRKRRALRTRNSIMGLYCCCRAACSARSRR